MNRCRATVSNAANPQRVASRLTMVIATLLLLCGGSALAADQLVATRVGAIIADYNKVMSDFTRAYMTGGTTENRERIVRERYPQIATYSEKLFAAATKVSVCSSISSTAVAWSQESGRTPTPQELVAGDRDCRGYPRALSSAA